MKNKIITSNRLKELLDYNLEAGIFTWKKRTSNRVSVGSRAGRDNGNGYRRISVDGQSYYEHQLAWLYVYDEWPINEIDHRDGNGSNNKISNLRHATHEENCQNMPLKTTNTSGATGVSWSKLHSRWEAYIWRCYKKKYLGLFDSLSDAQEAYLKAKLELHTFQPKPRNTI